MCQKPASFATGALSRLVEALNKACTDAQVPLLPYTQIRPDASHASANHSKGMLNKACHKGEASQHTLYLPTIGK